MKEKIFNIVEGKPYPVAAGNEYGYRVFDGKQWHDCDETGKIKNNRIERIR